MSVTTDPSRFVPLVVQVGFAGARMLVDREQHPRVDAAEVEAAVGAELTRFLKELPAELNPGGGAYHFCGISQVAIGADTLFTNACREAGMMQRIFLPQTIDDYLSGGGSSGPDFEPEQREAARELLRSGHIIQTRVVSDADGRHERFRDANEEIVRVSDLLVCVVREAHEGQAGGTLELLELAKKRGRAAVVLTVGIDGGGMPVVETEWINRGRFRLPELPESLRGLAFSGEKEGVVPKVGTYCRFLKDLASNRANQLRDSFKYAALIIVLGHVAATILAVVSLKVPKEIVASLLATEFLLLGVGFLLHHRLHRAHSIGRWASYRLLAEVARSVEKISPFHVYLSHFFQLPFPAEFRPVLRTVSVLHLRDSRAGGDGDWERERGRYVEERLLSADAQAQIPYQERVLAKARKSVGWAHRVFYTFSALAIAAVALKLLASCNCLPLGKEDLKTLSTLMGVCAVVSPVIAVAAMSLATAFDLEARLHTAEEMLAFLKEQVTILNHASTSREFSRLLIETENRLLGETVNWYGRRSFVGVA